MEMAVGLAYACHTKFVHLPEGHRVEFPDRVQERTTMLWSNVWSLFEELGLKATPCSGGALGLPAPLMEHPVGQAASAAKPNRNCCDDDMNDDNATAARLLPREEDTQGAPSSAAQPAASSKEKPTEEQKNTVC